MPCSASVPRELSPRRNGDRFFAVDTEGDVSGAYELSPGHENHPNQRQHRAGKHHHAQDNR